MNENIEVLKTNDDSVFKPIISSPVSFTLKNNETIELTLNLLKIYRLKYKQPKLYENYNNALLKQKEADLLSLVTIVYTAYVCNKFETDNFYNFEEFLELCPEDLETLGDIVDKLISKKNK